MGPPPHAHQELDELMYVVEGTASVLVDREVVEVPTGAWHLRPRRIKHTFWNASEKPLRFFDMYFNQPFEEFLERLFHDLTPEKGYPLDSEKRQHAIARLYEKFGVVQFSDSLAEHQAIMARYGLS
jgi:oxalate decarboxylase/phosphoglucose isomerase-like protein (cupin superfamily)